MQQLSLPPKQEALLRRNAVLEAKCEEYEEQLKALKRDSQSLISKLSNEVMQLRKQVAQSGQG